MRAATVCLTLLVARGACGQETMLLWGDTHLHTSSSADSYSLGNYFADPDTAYRFAKGVPVLHPRLQTRVQIGRPLDFLVVADHAERLRWQVSTRDGLDMLQQVPGYREAQAFISDNPSSTFFIPPGALSSEYESAIVSPEYRRAAWSAQVDAAERHNEPGRFTTLAGWEWSSYSMANLHRVVFTPSPAEVVKQFIPYSNAESIRPEDLWRWLEETSAATGAEFVAIPHNSNLSKGLMFAETDSDGRPIDAAYARQRIRWEPVMEVTQVKGTSEAHPAFSPTDEFAAFELYTKLLGGGIAVPSKADYARPALLNGLSIEERVGTNPFKFGLIGASDSHTGLVTVEEDDFYGKAVYDTLPEERLNPPGRSFPAWEMSSGGLAGVWAADNTRDDIAAAFRRREVYATSGPRIMLRVFGGFDFAETDADAADLAAVGYAGGVPMGGDLAEPPERRALSLLILAAKDPANANLDRAQVVKGWIDADGEQHEQVYDVAWSGDRIPDANGRVAGIGTTVDAARASYDDSIGDAQFRTVWIDPEFDAEQRSFYYVRVLQIPTPRHSTYDAAALGVDVSDTNQPVSLQERAWSSPIWYTPRR
ncbi:MAG: DUF3604 domain-containing protein [Gammaproteobacteria bacterium]|jgi:hypothetical protein